MCAKRGVKLDQFPVALGEVLRIHLIKSNHGTVDPSKHSVAHFPELSLRVKIISVAKSFASICSANTKVTLTGSLKEKCVLSQKFKCCAYVPLGILFLTHNERNPHAKKLKKIKI